MKNNGKIEILAPAGSAEMLKAAVYTGADAVYLGLESFNARRSAANFSKEAFAEAAAFCHARGVKVHVTLNTTLYPNELEQAADFISFIAKAGADAVIVQDLAVAQLCFQIAPKLAMHGSTQMSVHSLDGAKQLAQMGFSRAILSRELSLAEIEHISQNCGIETEVFVHGALCMSVSGQCYMSAFLGGRSGNRGACAGPCRLPFSASQEAGYHLSLKDMSVIDMLPQLAKAGVASVKIEGRLRTPEYAAAAVNACKNAMNGESYDKQLLQNVFSRSGFTDGYIKGVRDKNMFGVRTEIDAKAGKDAVPKLRELFRREGQNVAVDMSLTLEEDGAKLSVTDKDGTKAVVYGEITPQTAQKDPSAAYETALSKTGGTPFYTDKITLNGAEALFIPSGEINDMRRRALDLLLTKRSNQRGTNVNPPLPIPSQHHAMRPSLTALQFASVSQMPFGTRADMFIFPLDEWREVPPVIRAKTYLAVPRVLYGAQEQKAQETVNSAAKNGFAGFFVQNIAHIYMCNGYKMFGAFGLNVTNQMSAQYYAQLGLEAVTLSPELTLGDMEKIAPSAKTAVIAYGYMPLMLTRACPLHNVHSCKGCTKKGTLTDRMGKKFAVRCDGAENARTIYNTVPVYMLDRLAEIPADIAVLSFTTEPQQQIEYILQAYKTSEKPQGEFTRALYYKGTQ